MVANAFVEPPDPTVHTPDALSRRLRLLKAWAGDPSYATIARRINAGHAGDGADWLPTSRTTVADCFRAGRRRHNEELVLAIVRALHPDAGYVRRWRAAVRAMRGGGVAADFVVARSGLPAEPDGFTGRDRELAEIVAAAGAGDTVVIEGMGGVGKTRVAVRAAHRIARQRHFDHILSVDLRGFDPDPGQPPPSPTAVLRLLSVPRERIPYTLDGGVGLLRDCLRERTALLLLDDAASAEQVLALLSRESGSAVLITSRRRLTGLPGTRHVPLGALPPADAVALLRRTIGTERADAEPDRLARIAELAGGLPLALGLIAGRIGADPSWSLADHHDRLADHLRRLRLDDAVTASIRLSYDRLPAEHRRTMRYLALHPGPHVDGTAAAALTGTDEPTATRRLHDLQEHSLLTPQGPGRHGIHDLVRAFARAMALDTLRAADRRAAEQRLGEHYLALATAAVRAAFPGADPPLLPAAPAPVVPTQLDPAAGLSLVETELPNLLAIARSGATGCPEHTALLAIVLHRPMMLRSHYADLITLHELGLDAAWRCGNRPAAAWLSRYLGGVCLRVARYDRAAKLLTEALALFGAMGDVAGAGDTLHNLALVDRQLGHHRRAASRFRRALDARQAAGDRRGYASTLVNLGILDQMAGRYRRAAEHHERAEALFCDLDQLAGVALAQQNRGVVHLLSARPDEAAVLLRRAVAAYRQCRDHGGLAHALADLATACRSLGRHADALAHVEEALELAERQGDGYVHAYALNVAGHVHREDGRPDRAVALHERALDFFRDTGDPAGQADARNAIAEARLASGRRSRPATRTLPPTTAVPGLRDQ